MASKCKRPKHSYFSHDAQKKFSSLQRNWNEMISVYLMIGWTDGRREKTFLLGGIFFRYIYICFLSSGIFIYAFKFLTKDVYEFSLSFKYQDAWYLHAFIISLVGSYASNTNPAPMILGIVFANCPLFLLIK